MWAESLKPDLLVPLMILEQPLLFYRDQYGVAAALDDMCPHRLAPLSLGRLLPNGNLQCGYHGLEFDSSGQCVRNPHGSGRIPRACAVHRYTLVERHRLLWIWPGDETPDPGAIPDFSFLDEDSGYDVGPRDTIRMDSNYRNIIDNLMDLSHASFLHPDLLGNEETIQARIDIKQEGNSVQVRRDMNDVRPPLLRDLLFKQDGARVNMWNSIRWDAPSALLNDVGTYAPEADPAQFAGQLGCHILTPQTADTTLYFTAAAKQGPLASRSADGEVDFKARIAELRRTAFKDQDDPMIRAQQINIRLHPGVRPVLFEIDAAPVRCQRILNALIEEEQKRVSSRISEEP
ncbi:Toluene-4-sulfonate monooxygenase system iron-sulfur subunit TsaM1 [Pigmentiphaga humi]|uniref:Toluene-4-sulfonate monooxygenase system iron-sulfur subunit TsaM1 n=1 Tax=Pigmentiphaga humi TaxID=2478468 RepID=A0A3P4B4Y3_9BURK|nr:aromatic ring-hydroxylating dioxygenase subunit alpha [Pigmentiphaga humi]VCU70718.1 Toluene-4-sulfonate monooxygenase system iron-sulfur subunit TsaM1 [Pigmentiphaga humi]